MRYNVTVDVPYARKMPYTLFAKGSLSDIPHVDDGADFVHFKFSGGTVFVLFYTFADFRRAYIVTGFQDERDGEAVTLPGITEPLCLIFTARGRKIDHLKRCVYLLTKYDEHTVFSLPLSFWYKLAALIQFHGAKKSDVLLLYESFTQKQGRK